MALEESDEEATQRIGNEYALVLEATADSMLLPDGNPQRLTIASSFWANMARRGWSWERSE